MICNGIELISDYLNFDYELKLSVINDRGIDLPAISVCTESNVLFDKRKVLLYFDLSREYLRLENEVKLKWDYYENCRRNKRTDRYQDDADSDHMMTLFLEKYSCCEKIVKTRFASLKRFYHIYEKMIFDHLSYEQMIALIMTSEELFECRASVHFANQTIGSNQTIIDNCWQRFRVSRDIYANNDFGICYKFFDNNYQIILNYNDIIEIRIKYESIMNFMFNFVFDRHDKIDSSIQDLFRFYYFAESNTKILPTKDFAILTEKTRNNRLNAFIKTLSFDMLSTPYMQYCQRNGKQSIIIIHYPGVSNWGVEKHHYNEISLI